MIKEAPVEWDDLSTFVQSVGYENIISIIPLKYTFSQDGVATHHGQKYDSIGSVVVDKYLVIYVY